MATTQKLTYVGFAEIEKVEDQDDGSVLVTGIASDETLDGDRQICDYAWSSKALKKWLETGGNIRSQHNPSLLPAGVGIEVETNDVAKSSTVTAHVVEPTAVRLVKAKALRAFSIGIANPRVIKDVTAPGGRIVGGEIVETSLVDRPSNPSCGIKLMKGGDGVFAVDTWDSGFVAKDDKSNDDSKDDSDDGDDNASDATPPGDGDTDSDDAGGDDNDDDANKAADGKGKKCKTCKGSGKIMDGNRTCPDCHGSGKQSDVDASKSQTEKHGKRDQLGKSTRRERKQVVEVEGKQEASHEDDGQAHGASDQPAIKGGIDASDASSSESVQVEKLDLTSQTAPIVKPVNEKRDRSSGGTFSTHSNPVDHDPNHHDSTAPSQVVNAPTYAGQAAGTTPMGTIPSGESVGSRQEEVDQALTPSAATGKSLSAERIAWFIGKSDVSTKPKREGAKYSLKDADGEVKFPINDCSDVKDAWGLRGNSSIDKGTVAAYVRKCAKKLGCPDPGAASDAKKAAKKMRKQRKLIAKLQKQAKSAKRKQAKADARVAADARPTVEKWNDLVDTAKRLEDEKTELTTKLEKISALPTLGKAQRAPTRVRATDKSASTTAEAPTSAVDEAVAERIEFLEGVARLGNADQQDVAQTMLAKLRDATIHKQA